MDKIRESALRTKSRTAAARRGGRFRPDSADIIEVTARYEDGAPALQQCLEAILKSCVRE